MKWGRTMEWRWSLVLAALLAPAVCLAAEDAASTGSCEEAYAALPHGTILDLLDPEAPEQRRAAALSAYERLAGMKQCPEFAYTLGQLYRHGPDLPGNPLPQDVEKAIELIRPMAEDGYLAAFADLAEMQMRHANAREAMRWTQVYLHFVRKVQMDFAEDADALQYNRAAYNGNLLARTEIIWKNYARPPLPRRTVAEDLNAYLSEHGASVTARMRERQQGLHRRVSAQDAGQARVASDLAECYLKPKGRIGAGSAAWIVEVLPSGETGRIVLENFVPSSEFTREMEECLMRYEFAPFQGEESATVRIAMVMGSPDGAAMRRTRRR